MVTSARSWICGRIESSNQHSQRFVSATDRGIDRFFYGLYGLTEDVLAIVKGATVATAEP
jgi:hypothetical protein